MRLWSLLLSTYLAISCSASTPPAQFACRPTVARMTPPAEVIEFIVAGSSEPEITRAGLRTANFFGNEALWLLLPENGEINGRLSDKLMPYRMKAGQLQWQARRLDGSATVRKQPAGPSGYGDIGFQAGGVGFPESGCWEVTYTLSDQYPLTFVLQAKQ